MKLCHIDADVNGVISIEHLVPDWVQTFSCLNYKEVESVVHAVRSGRLKCDMVVLDTITGLTTRLRQDLVYDPVGVGAGSPLWDKRKELKANWDHFRATSDLTNRITMLFMILNRDLGIPCVVIAHEKHTKDSESRSDPMSGDDKFIPNLQAGINECLYAYADAIVRLSPATKPVVGLDPRGTRILTLRPTTESSAGIRVRGDLPQPPEYIVVPDNDPQSFKQFVTIIGRIPKLMLLYGPPKVGKTVFISGACYFAPQTN